MSTATSTLTTQRVLDVFLANVRHFHENNPRLAKFLAVALAALPFAPRLLDSYRGYLALGRGGLPHNIIGWMVQGVLLPFSKGDTRSTTPFTSPAAEKAYGPHGSETFLSAGGPLPVRVGERPTVPGYVVPQRQTSDTAPRAVATMNAYLAALAGANPRVLAINPSVLENADAPALHLVPPPGSHLPSYLASSTRGEVAHVHPEGSAHVVLSLKDAHIAVSQGWAEQHKLSGRGLPTTYVMLYAPRDDAEMEVWKRLVNAAVAFTTAGWDEEIKFDV